MRVNTAGVATAALLLLPACAGFPSFRKQRADDASAVAAVCGTEEPTHTELELGNPRYDGETFSGRLLIGAITGRPCLDKRLIGSVSVNVDSVRDCATSLPVTYILADALSRPPREEDLLVLAPGYWYGGPARFRLFSEPLGQRGPDCIEVALSIYSARSTLLGRVSARAERPPAPSSGASTTLEPSQTDGGTPPIPNVRPHE